MRRALSYAASFGVLGMVVLGVWAGSSTSEAQALVSAGFARLTSIWQEPSGYDQASSEETCAHLNNRFLHRSGNISNLVDYEVAYFVAESNVAARATISDIRSPRFETETGAPPAPLPPDPTEEELEDYPERVLSPIVLDATHIYSGPLVTGYVVARFGGTTADCPGYDYQVSPQILTGDVDSEGMVMLFDPPDDWLTDPPGWFAHLVAVADELSQEPGMQYEPKLHVNWYRYDHDTGMAESSLQPPMTISQLEAEVEAATGP